MPKPKSMYPYTCPRCQYTTPQKNDMRRHLNSKRGCPQLYMLVELTDAVKEEILSNRVFGPRTLLMNMDAELPDVTKTSKNKSFYQKVVEAFLGKGRMNLEGFLTDVTTDTAHAQIRRWKDYTTCIGELVSNNFLAPRRELHAYMFDESCGEETIGSAVKGLTGVIGPRAELKLFSFTHLENAVHIVNYITGDVVFEYQIPK